MHWEVITKKQIIHNPKHNWRRWADNSQTPTRSLKESVSCSFKWGWWCVHQITPTQLSGRQAPSHCSWCRPQSLLPWQHISDLHWQRPSDRVETMGYKSGCSVMSWPVHRRKICDDNDDYEKDLRQSESWISFRMCWCDAHANGSLKRFIHSSLKRTCWHDPRHSCHPSHLY